MIKIIYIRDYKDKKDGEIEEVSNNVAHGLIESGVAMKYQTYNTSAILRAPVDRMFKADRKRYRIK